MLSKFRFVSRVLVLLALIELGFGGTTIAEELNAVGGNDKGVTRPVNDDFANSIALFGSSVFTSGNNVNATSELGGDLFSTVWWSWTAPGGIRTDEAVRIDLAGSDFDTYLVVFEGSDLSNLQLVAQNDDCGIKSDGKGSEKQAGSGLESCLSFVPEPNVTYHILVDGLGATDQGQIVLGLDVIGRPPNDDFQNSIALNAPDFRATGSNVNATTDNVGGLFSTVWWSWTAPSDLCDGARATIDLTGSDFDTFLVLFQGQDINSLTELGRNDDCGFKSVERSGEKQSASGLESCLTFLPVANTTYYFEVDGFSSTDQGNIVIDLDVISSDCVTGDCSRVAQLGGIVHVQRDGSDLTGDGSASAPWASIRFALAQIAGCGTKANPTTIQLGEGDFKEAVRLPKNVILQGAPASDTAGIRTTIRPGSSAIAMNTDPENLRGSVVLCADGYTELRDLRLLGPGAANASNYTILTINNVQTIVDTVIVDGNTGSTTNSTIGINILGTGSSNSMIMDSAVRRVTFGVSALETSAAVRRTDFDSIAQDALILENPEGGKQKGSGAILDLGSVSIDDDRSNIGGNTFRGGKSIGGNFINNRISDARVSAEGNDFGITQFDGIADRVRGDVDFEPRLNPTDNSLTTKLDVDVRDTTTLEGIAGATVTVGQVRATPLGTTIGSYAFQGVSYARISVRVSAPDYVEKVVSVANPDLSAPLVVLLERAVVGTEGEGEGPVVDPIVVRDVASLLIGDFNLADTNFDGVLSEEEVSAWLGNVSMEVFDEIDSNQDGFLSLEELNAVFPCTGGCCPQVQKEFVERLKNRTGDLFLMGLAGLVLLAGSRRGRQW